MLSAFAVLQRIAEEYDGKPPVTVRLVDWADEEGARFGRSLFGSSAFAGTQTIEADRGRTDATGIRLEDALADCGVASTQSATPGASARMPPRISSCTSSRGRCWRAWTCRWARCSAPRAWSAMPITFHGQEAHSGSTPMNARRDALAAAAKLALEIRPIARKHPDAVCTMGSVKTFPGIVTAVVGRCEATLDQRDLDAGRAGRNVPGSAGKEQPVRRRKKAARWSGRASGTLRRSRFIPQLIEFCEEAIRETAGALASPAFRPLHDAAEVSRAGIPTVMMFVQSLKGISHNKIEDTREEHLELAMVALDRLAQKTMDWIRKSERAQLLAHKSS